MGMIKQLLIDQKDTYEKDEVIASAQFKYYGWSGDGVIVYCGKLSNEEISVDIVEFRGTFYHKNHTHNLTNTVITTLLKKDDFIENTCVESFKSIYDKYRKER